MGPLYKSRTISPRQRRLLYAVARENGLWSREEILDYIDRWFFFDCAHLSDLTHEQLDRILRRLQTE